MENIKQRLSDVAHSWTVIGMITLFLFGVQPEVMTPAKALVVKPETKTEAQLRNKRWKNSATLCTNLQKRLQIKSCCNYSSL